MKKLLMILAIIICASFAQADILTTWTVNDPGATMTAQSVFYREDPGATGDQALLDGTGFTEIPLQLADRQYQFTTLTEGVSYCFYWQAVSAGPSYFKSDVLCGTNAPARQIQRIQFFKLIDNEAITPLR